MCFNPRICSRDEEELDDDNALQAPNGSIIFHHVTKENEGSYHCEASNNEGTKSRSKSAYLTVTGKSACTLHSYQ